MRKFLFIALLSVLYLLPANAVFNEKDLPHTLSVLRFELKSTYDEYTTYGMRINKNNILQHEQMLQMLDKCDELALILYSQQQDNTFDLTYACHEVKRLNKLLGTYRAPFLEVMSRLNIELERYKNLQISLQRMPTAALRTKGEHVIKLTEETEANRKVCLFYVREIIKINQNEQKTLHVSDVDYAIATKRLSELDTYAQKRYQTAQHKIFDIGQENYFYVLSHLTSFVPQAFENASDKYKAGALNNEYSEWRGVKMIGFFLFIIVYIAIATVLSHVIIRLLSRKIKRFRSEEMILRRPCIISLAGIMIFILSIYIAKPFISGNYFFVMAFGLLNDIAWILAVILASLLIRLKGEQMRSGMKVYTPLMCLGIMIIIFRIIFIPNRMINLLFPALLVLFIIWQSIATYRYQHHITIAGMVYAWISLIVISASAVAAWAGYVMLSVQINIWWIFQLTMLLSITSIFHLLKVFYKGGKITKTWFYELVHKAGVPVLSICSIPYCVYLAADVFNLSDVCRAFFARNFIDVEGIIQISPSKVILVASLFFVFFYLVFAAKSFYDYFKLDGTFNKHKPLNPNEANLTLANNVIGIVLWGIYVIIAMVLLNIPKEGISIITAGLATGVGFAMRDILNNFFYGIQLMAGRVHIGDFIECDGVRGKVDSITYQSTQILTIDGCVMAFLNSDLFTKNFKNLTRNHAYELIVINVGVAYGSKIEAARQVILRALQPLQIQDGQGRDVVSKNRDVTVEIVNFGDNSIDLAIKQLVLVENEYTYKADARERIYNALNENNIEIPFPQRDVHMKE